jgi:hypothetical protein
MNDVNCIYSDVVCYIVFKLFLQEYHENKITISIPTFCLIMFQV